MMRRIFGEYNGREAPSTAQKASEVRLWSLNGEEIDQVRKSASEDINRWI